MASTETHVPAPNCCICINLGRRVPAEATVVARDGRDYQGCLEHAQEMTLGGFANTLRTARTNPTKGAL